MSFIDAARFRFLGIMLRHDGLEKSVNISPYRGLAESMKDKFGETDSGSGDPSDIAKRLYLSVSELLNGAELFCVTQTTESLIQTAANVLPMESLYSDDLFCQSGIVILQKPLQIECSDRHGGDGDADAVAWATTHTGMESAWGDDRHGIIFAIFRSGQLHPQSIAGWPYGDGWHTQYTERGDINTRKFLLSFWRLIKQKILVSEHGGNPARAIRKRAKEAEVDISKTLIITLRSIKRTGGGAEGECNVNWSHRWGVRGHWRSQWYPKKYRHEQIYINPYIKGPEDKPLVVKDRVFKVSR